MRRNTRYIILTATVALCTGVSLPFLLGSSVLNTEQQSVKSEVPYCVTSPTVPSQISFAGQDVDLLRYDHRERMDRELMSFTYMHSTTMLTIKRANRYFPVIEPILKANGIPDDFKYPVEHAFIGDAYPDLLKWVSGDSKHVQWYKSKNTVDKWIYTREQ